MGGRLAELFSRCGQSAWLDNLQRGYLDSGHLESLIRRGVRGLTSNPTIFQKAIQGSTDYDAQFADAISRGLSPYDAYWELVLSDIVRACDLFDPLFRSTGGADGFVSVEVDPSLAHDGPATLAAARALHERVGRPNAMIKIPATVEGLPAIRAMIAEGRNVNVTLIFSLDRYEAVMDAYIGGLEDRQRKGLEVSGIASVASFFISRVDTEVDRRLAAADSDDARSLAGTAAINQARLAYSSFQRAFSGPRWDSLAAAGAAVQRPLWASTSTKNPSYPDTLYVDQLIGPHTVNTLPDATLEAFDDHGTIGRTIDTDPSASAEQWALLGSVGVDTDDVAALLEREGVASFIASFDELIATLGGKADALS